MQTKIIYEDAHVIVCHKPAGLATQSGKIGQPDVVSELKNYLAGKPAGNTAGAGQKKPVYLGVLHRLDQPVEGLLVFAKTAQAAACLTKQLTAGSLNKQYVAAVWGKVEPKEGELVDYLVKEGNLARVASAKTAGAKKAVLQYQVLEEQERENAQTITLVRIHIDTGRFHQIRVQMSHAGWPLLGDSKYGVPESQLLSRQLKVCSVALYADRVAFVHPESGKLLHFEIQTKPAGIFGKEE